MTLHFVISAVWASTVFGPRLWQLFRAQAPADAHLAVASLTSRGGPARRHFLLYMATTTIQRRWFIIHLFLDSQANASFINH